MLTPFYAFFIIHTHREVSEHEVLIRIISARKATKREQQQYEKGI